MNVYWELFSSFSKIGALTFGGGYAMLPMIRKEAMEKKGWVTAEEVVDDYAVAQCLPGVIAVNTALLIGHKVKGNGGGVAAALGVVAPSFVIILAIAAFLQNFIEVELVQRAFFGVRVVVCALIVQAILKMWKSAVKDIFGVCVYVAALVLSLWCKVSVVALVVLAVAAGIAYDTLKRRREKI